MNRSCEPFRDAIVRDLYGEASPAETAGIERHVALCPECAREKERLARAHGALDRLASSPDLSPGAAEAMAAIVRDRGRAPMPRTRRTWRPLAAAAAILGGLSAFHFLGGPSAYAEVEVVRLETGVTVYSSGFGLVRDRRRILNLARGANVVRYADVASGIDPTSVGFKALGDARACRVLEQNYEFDLATGERVLDKHLDSDVVVHGRDGRRHAGRLLARDPAALILDIPPAGSLPGGIEMIPAEHVSRVSCPSLADGLLARPTLVWDLDAPRGGRQETEISYLTSGISWRADYVGVVSEETDALDLSAWVTIDNRSGASYHDARLQLVAGDVQRIAEDLDGIAYCLDMAGGDAHDETKAGFEEQALFEYHLYTLQRPATVPDRAIQQIELFPPVARVPLRRRYFYEGDGNDVQVRVSFDNKEAAGLGMPLPAGLMRLSKADPDGSMQFVGEDRIDHTPRDEDVELVLGNAFDLVGERVLIEQRHLGPRIVDTTLEYRLRNHKDEAVEIVAVLPVAPDAEIVSLPADLTANRKDASTIEIPVPVPPGPEGRTFRITLRTGG